MLTCRTSSSPLGMWSCSTRRGLRVVACRAAPCPLLKYKVWVKSPLNMSISIHVRGIAKWGRRDCVTAHGLRTDCQQQSEEA